jgi:hypothetical protein
MLPLPTNIQSSSSRSSQAGKIAQIALPPKNIYPAFGC